jgi:CRP/FNR family transcriptional regulator, cyclic AMP receptor protein
MTEGDPVRYVGALLQGRVKVSRVDVDGNTTVFAVRGPGELLGEIGVLSRDRRSATVTAIDRCELSIIEAERFSELIRELGIERPLLAHLSRKIEDNNRLRSEIAGRPAGVRLARALVHLANYAVRCMVASEDSAIDLGLDQEDLGNVVRLSRQTVSIELTKLRELGLIETPRGHVVVADLRGLRAHRETSAP